MFEVNLDDLDDENTIKLSKRFAQSICVKNIIKDEYGDTRIYKNKKRLEIRWNKNIIENSCCFKVLNI